MKTIWYLAGPMTGIPKFNYPAFLRAAVALRIHAFNLVTPVELADIGDNKEAAMNSPNGDRDSDGITATWGDYLSRDVKIIADQVTGIIFLDGWEKSKGARLEAFVAVLAGHKFARYVGAGVVEGLSTQTVLAKLMRHTAEDLRNGTL